MRIAYLLRGLKDPIAHTLQWFLWLILMFLLCLKALINGTPHYLSRSHSVGDDRGVTPLGNLFYDSPNAFRYGYPLHFFTLSHYELQTHPADPGQPKQMLKGKRFSCHHT